MPDFPPTSVTKADVSEAVDSFNRADSAVTLGTTENRPNTPPRTWQVSGPSAWGISGNRAYRTGNQGHEQAVVDVGSTDHEVEGRMWLVPGDYTALAFRWVDVNNYAMVQLHPTGECYLVTTIAGVTSAAGPYALWAPGDLFMVRVMGAGGSTGIISLFRNGVLQNIAGPTTLPMGTKVGFNAYNINNSNTARFDDFRARAFPVAPLHRVTVGTVAPAAPATNDIWIDTT